MGPGRGRRAPPPAHLRRGGPARGRLRHSPPPGSPDPPPRGLALGGLGPGTAGPGVGASSRGPSASRCHPAQGSGRAPPPPLLGGILGPQTRPNPARFGPNFSGFLGTCGAPPRGGGGAPPTTLILLRNQRSVARARRTTLRRSGGAVRGGQTEGKRGEICFLTLWLSVRGVEDRGVAIACGDVAVGGPSRAPLHPIS